MGTDVNVADVREKHVSDYLAGNGFQSLVACQRARNALSVFFRYAISRGHLDSSPMLLVIPKPPPRFVPYIFSREELHRLLQATDR